MQLPSFLIKRCIFTIQQQKWIHIYIYIFSITINTQVYHIHYSILRKPSFLLSFLILKKFSFKKKNLALPFESRLNTNLFWILFRKISCKEKRVFLTIKSKSLKKLLKLSIPLVCWMFATTFHNPFQEAILEMTNEKKRKEKKKKETRAFYFFNNEIEKFQVCQHNFV